MIVRTPAARNSVLLPPIFAPISSSAPGSCLSASRVAVQIVELAELSQTKKAGRYWLGNGRLMLL